MCSQPRPAQYGLTPAAPRRIPVSIAANSAAQTAVPNFVELEDPDVWAAIAAEQTRQAEGLEMIASENFTSPAVMQAVGGVLTNKYAEGYPGHRYYGGCEFVDKVEDLARERLKKLFGAEHVNVQPHSGSQANSSGAAGMGARR